MSLSLYACTSCINTILLIGIILLLYQYSCVQISHSLFIVLYIIAYNFIHVMIVNLFYIEIILCLNISARFEIRFVAVSLLIKY